MSRTECLKMNSYCMCPVYVCWISLSQLIFSSTSSYSFWNYSYGFLPNKIMVLCERIQIANDNDMKDGKGGVRWMVIRCHFFFSLILHRSSSQFCASFHHFRLLLFVQSTSHKMLKEMNHLNIVGWETIGTNGQTQIDPKLINYCIIILWTQKYIKKNNNNIVFTLSNNSFSTLSDIFQLLAK